LQVIGVNIDKQNFGIFSGLGIEDANARRMSIFLIIIAVGLTVRAGLFLILFGEGVLCAFMKYSTNSF
jgi:hypothetical protein